MSKSYGGHVIGVDFKKRTGVILCHQDKKKYQFSFNNLKGKPFITSDDYAKKNIQVYFKKKFINNKETNEVKSVIKRDEAKKSQEKLGKNKKRYRYNKGTSVR